MQTKLPTLAPRRKAKAAPIPVGMSSVIASTITYAASSLSGAEVDHQIVSALDAAIQIVDRQALVVAVDARNFSLAENHRDESVCRHALGAQKARVSAASGHPRDDAGACEIARDDAL